MLHNDSRNFRITLADPANAPETAPPGSPKGAPDAHQETADAFARVICHPAHGWRVVVCKDCHQWIIQRRKKGDAQRPWRGVSYHRTRDAMARRCATLCGHPDPEAMTALGNLPVSFPAP